MKTSAKNLMLLIEQKLFDYLEMNVKMTNIFWRHI